MTKSTKKASKSWWNTLAGTERARLKKLKNLSSDQAIERHWLANVAPVNASVTTQTGATNGAN